MGDGETGGNVACYPYDPDWHNIAFCGAMDTTTNALALRGTMHASGTGD